MNIYLILGILIANLISITIVYQFIKKLEKKQKLVFIAASVAVMYVLISFVYWISGFGIDEKIHEESKNFVLYLFVPVNVILFIPYLAAQYMKLRLGQLKIEKFINKLSMLVVLLIVVLVVEYFYFKNIQENIKNMDIQVQITNEALEDIETVISNEINNNINEQEVIINTVVVNDVNDIDEKDVLGNEVEGKNIIERE